jgi:hypothetical protein
MASFRSGCTHLWRVEPTAGKRLVVLDDTMGKSSLFLFVTFSLYDNIVFLVVLFVTHYIISSESNPEKPAEELPT